MFYPVLKEGGGGGGGGEKGFGPAIFQFCSHPPLPFPQMTGPLEPKSFHVSVQNSQGSFPEPGTLLGRAEATGSYEQCLNLEPTYDYVYDENWQKVGQYDFKMNYCKTRYFTKDNLVSDPFNANSFS